MTKNGCHNRAPLAEYAYVQYGWRYKLETDTREPDMIGIPVPMSKHCQYSRDKKDDPKCKGCRWMEVPIKEVSNV